MVAETHSVLSNDDGDRHPNGSYTWEAKMSYRRFSVPLAIAALALSAVSAQAQNDTRPPQRPMAQQQQQMHQQQMQQQMVQMQQHMVQLRERIQKVDGDLTRAMERTRDQTRLREHQALREMCTDLGSMTRQMERSANRLEEMVQNRMFQGDEQLQREAQRLREQYRQMEQRMEQSVQALERMQHRLGQLAESDS